MLYSLCLGEEKELTLIQRYLRANDSFSWIDLFAYCADLHKIILVRDFFFLYNLLRVIYV